MRLVPKNWEQFQHYTGRRPPWIKLHRKLLDDRAFSRLELASKALAPLLWLLASEDEGGSFDADIEELEFRLPLKRKEIAAGLRGLIEAGFLLPAASNTLAPCEQLAPGSVSVSVPLSLSDRREHERGAEKGDPDFERFWDAYSKKVGRKDAWKAWRRIAPAPELVARMLEVVPAYVAATPEKQYRKDPATWLNGACWENEVITKPTNTNGRAASPVPKVIPEGYYGTGPAVQDL